MKTRARIAVTLMATAVALAVAGCGGASDSTDRRELRVERRRRHEALARRLRRAEGRLRQGHPAVSEDARRQGRRRFSQSYGASGDQSRKVAAGLTTDVVNFSVEPDVTKLVDAGLVAEDWNAGEHKGIPFGSVVTIVDAQGQPEGHQDLGRPAQARASRSSRRTRSARARRSGTCSRRTPRRARAARTPRRASPTSTSSSPTTSRCSRSPAARRPRRSCRAPATCC